jgi:hypothetical protein
MFSPNSRNSGGGGQDTAPSGANLGAVFGEAITPEQLTGAMREARIVLRRNSGQWPEMNDENRKQLTQIADQQLLLDAELQQFHITVTPDAAARYTKIFLGVKPTDSVPPERIMDAVARLVHEGNISLDDFDNFIRHQAGQDYLISLLGMNGDLITPQEAAVFYRRENAPVQTEFVSFPASNFLSSVHPTAQDLEDYYTKRQADYRLPDRIQVHYVAFDLSNYTAKAEKELGTNLNDHIDEEYYQAGADSFKDASGKQLSAEAAKAKIRKQNIDYTALNDAVKDANSLLNDLSQGHDDDHPYTTNDIVTLANARHLTVKTTEPFDEKTGPEDLAIFPKSLPILFSLRADDPDDKEHSMIYAPSPILGENGVYIACLANRIPSEVQPLSAVKKQVEADYKEDQALELAKAAGDRFQKALQEGLSQGKTFTTMCAAQFIRSQKLTPFSLTTESIPEITDKAEFEQLQDVVGKMHPGQVSPFIPIADGGFFVYYKGDLPVDESAMQRNFPAFLARMRQRLQIAAFSAWFNHQYQLHFSPPPGESLGG